jgi:hypothetical protein
MFSFIRRVFRPIGYIGQKLKNMFRIGRKAEVVREVRNVENIIPDAVRIPNYSPDHIDYATKYRDIWGQNVIRD